MKNLKTNSDLKHESDVIDNKIRYLPDSHVWKQQDPVESYLNNKYEIKYNTVTSKTEYRERICKPNSAFEEIDDYKLNSILRELKQAATKCTKDNLKSILKSDFAKRYDPFKVYFENLPEWDGKTDFIQHLANSVNTTNPELWKKCLKKWIVAVVASLMKDDIINHTALILSGDQGIGKTTWICKLVPEVLKRYFYTGTINPNNKDTRFQLAECMLINLDELQYLHRRELGSLKEIITKPHVKERRPYDIYDESLPHRASFIGSVNDMEFLSDTSGSRRFLCFEIIKEIVDHKIDIDLVYSQAYALYNSGFEYWFKGPEIDEIQTNNEKFQAKTPEEELLLRCFKSCKKENADICLNATEVCEKLKEQSSIQNLDSIKLGRILSNLKFVKFMNKDTKRYVYALKYRTTQ